MHSVHWSPRAQGAQVLLQYMGQVVRLLLASATDATARGMAAAGVEVGLPEEVRSTKASPSHLLLVTEVSHGAMRDPPLRCRVSANQWCQESSTACSAAHRLMVRA